MKTAYWFSFGHKLSRGDGRPIAIGTTHTVEGPLILCRHGLHASENIIEALDYAPGPICWQVELSGGILRDTDKLCASRRKYIAGGIDCTPVLLEFARKVATDVIDLWQPPQIVIEFLKTGDPKIRQAAWAATWAAASESARAARAAARAETWAAREETWAAASESARAAREAKRHWQNNLLEKMITDFWKKNI